jgi:hypothetical protein
MTPSTWARTLCLAASCTVALNSAGAQQIENSFTGFESGMRVRVTAPRLLTQKLTGTIVHMSADSVVIDTVDQRRVDRRFFPEVVLVEKYRQITLSTNDVDSVDVSLGQSRTAGMLRLGRNAALIGGTVAGLAYVSGYNQISFRNFAEGFRSGVKLGAVVGLSIGYTYGDEKWRSVGRIRPGLIAKN